jgi:UDP-N-acetylglucosamine acyltransferase
VTTIHSSAIIDPSAKLGKNISIGPFVVIGPHVEIGDDTKIISHVAIEYTSLGKNCVVYPQASLGFAPQHLKYKNETTKLQVGDNCTFREGVTAHRGTPLDKSITIIGNNGYFMALSHIAHDCVIGNNVIMANSAQLGGHVKVADNSFISASVGVHQFVRIGMGTIISGGAMVSQDVAPFCIAQGDRANLYGLNLVGLKRTGVDRNTIKALKEAYQAMFLKGLTIDEALQNPSLNLNNSHVKIFREFFLEPKRGYIRPRKVMEKNTLEETAI